MPPRKTSAVRPLRTLMLLGLVLVAIFGSVGAGTRFSDASWTPNLALDLEGGTQIILAPRTDDGSEITQDEVDQAIEVIRQRVDSSGVTEAEITRQGGQNIVVALPGRPDEATLDLVRQSAQLRFRAFLAEGAPGPVDPAAAAAAGATDPAAGTDDGQIEPGDGATEEPSEGATDGSTDSLPAPGDGAGVTSMTRPMTPTDEATTDEATDEATGTPTEGESSAPAEEPTDGETATAPPTQEEIEEAARTLADSDADGEISDTPLTEPADASDQAWVTEQVVYDFYVLDCTDPANRIGGGGDDPDAPLVTCSRDGTAKYILGPSEIEGSEIASASSGLRTNEQGQVLTDYGVDLQFTSAGSETFREVTTRLAGLALTQPGQNRFAIVLDALVVSAPSVDEVIPSGEAQITGAPPTGFNRVDASTLASQLNFGALPISFQVQSEEQISATLGSEQLQRGLLAGLIGLVLVVLYSLSQYRGLAIVTVASLVIAAGLTFGSIVLLSWLVGYRLSLPGVAGLIVAVGITADSFVVYFERIRDEVREGRRLDAAVEEGWRRARRTILASDGVNLLAAVVLYFLAVGGVRGFAFTLGLTTLIDLLVVIVFTHPMMQLLIRTKFFGQGHPWSGLDPEHLGSTAPAYRGRGSFRSPDERATGSIAARRAAAARAEAGDDDEPDDADADADADADELVGGSSAGGASKENRS